MLDLHPKLHSSNQLLASRSTRSHLVQSDPGLRCYNGGMKCRVRAVIFLDEQLLLVRNNSRQGVPKEFWTLPGGGIEDGEHLEAALEREMLEETGVKPQIGRLLFVHQFMRDGVYEGPEFYFEVTNAADYTHVDLAKTTHGAAEIAEIGFKDTKTLRGLKPAFLYGVTPGNSAGKTRLIIDGPEA